MPDLDLRVGLVRQVSDGAYIKSRATRDGAQTVQALHSPFYEATLRAFKFVATTGIAGVVVSSLTATAAGSSGFFSLYNPRNSYINVVLDKLVIGWQTGTHINGCLYHVVNPVAGAAPTTGTTVTPQASLIGSPAGTATAQSGTVTFNAAVTLYRPIASMEALTSATAQNPWQIVDEINGEIILLPGMTWGLQLIATTAVSGPTMAVSIAYEEVPSINIAGG